MNSRTAVAGFLFLLIGSAIWLVLLRDNAPRQQQVLLGGDPQQAIKLEGRTKQELPSGAEAPIRSVPYDARLLSARQLKVCDESTDEPIEGVSVAGGGEPPVSTGGDGLATLPGGTSTVFVVVAHHDYLTRVVSIEEGDGKEGPIVCLLRKGAAVAGRVVSVATGEPISDVAVSAESIGFPISIDPQCRPIPLSDSSEITALLGESAGFATAEKRITRTVETGRFRVSGMKESMCRLSASKMGWVMMAPLPTMIVEVPSNTTIEMGRVFVRVVDIVAASEFGPAPSSNFSRGTPKGLVRVDTGVYGREGQRIHAYVSKRAPVGERLIERIVDVAVCKDPDIAGSDVALATNCRISGENVKATFVPLDVFDARDVTTFRVESNESSGARILVKPSEAGGFRPQVARADESVHYAGLTTDAGWEFRVHPGQIVLGYGGYGWCKEVTVKPGEVLRITAPDPKNLSTLSLVGRLPGAVITDSWSAFLEPESGSPLGLYGWINTSTLVPPGKYHTTVRDLAHRVVAEFDLELKPGELLRHEFELLHQK